MLHQATQRKTKLLSITAIITSILAVITAMTWLLASPQFTAEAAGKPGKSTGLSATATDHNTVTLSWDAPSSGATPTKYRIYRRNMDDSRSMSKIGTSTETSYTDDSVLEGTNYRYRVAAVAGRKQGKKSDKADVTTPAAPESAPADTANVPHRPTSLSVSEVTAGQIVVTWNAPSDGPAATGYQISRHNVAEGTTTSLGSVESDTLTFTDSTVTEETWYGYYVAASNDAGEGTARGPEAIKSKNQTPGVPEEITALSVSEETAGQVVVYWTAATDGPAATGFKVYRERLLPTDEKDTGEVLIATVNNASATFYTDSTVAAGVSYEYHVRAKNDAGHSGAWRRALIRTQSE